MQISGKEKKRQTKVLTSQFPERWKVVWCVGNREKKLEEMNSQIKSSVGVWEVGMHYPVQANQYSHLGEGGMEPWTLEQCQAMAQNTAT